MLKGNSLTHVAATERDRGNEVGSDADIGGKEDGMKTGLHWLIGWTTPLSPLGRWPIPLRGTGSREWDRDTAPERVSWWTLSGGFQSKGWDVVFIVSPRDRSLGR